MNSTTELISLSEWRSAWLTAVECQSSARFEALWTSGLYFQSTRLCKARWFLSFYRSMRMYFCRRYWGYFLVFNTYNYIVCKTIFFDIHSVLSNSIVNFFSHRIQLLHLKVLMWVSCDVPVKTYTQLREFYGACKNTVSTNGLGKPNSCCHYAAEQ